ncbi:hypothetical protein [Kribbella sp. VKM Ac-2568]|uniref:hypothetical protein n=1 Tax=Kribbella sp. VKM Ac-2568 TaxID=2512219 RepID=UPI00104A33CD|nr:hypothetical protein [Kribbella sp. VKM Ac-2568]TCM42489.1 hypothetical protein EV648_11019 [Kribbella sp. VKM Ac-2568]
MLYTLSIPAQFAAAFAAGEVTLMTTAAGATTTLMAGGTIVGTATLAEVAAGGAGVGAGVAGGAGGAAVAGAAGAMLWPIVIGVGVTALVLGALWWRFGKGKPDTVDADFVQFEFEASPDEALDVLRRAQAIVDAALELETSQLSRPR